MPGDNHVPGLFLPALREKAQLTLRYINAAQSTRTVTQHTHVATHRETSVAMSRHVNSQNGSRSRYKVTKTMRRLAMCMGVLCTVMVNAALISRTPLVGEHRVDDSAGNSYMVCEYLGAHVKFEAPSQGGSCSPSSAVK
jgi:hypothetical protein